MTKTTIPLNKCVRLSEIIILLHAEEYSDHKAITRIADGFGLDVRCFVTTGNGNEWRHQSNIPKWCNRHNFKKHETFILRSIDMNRDNWLWLVVEVEPDKGQS